MVAMGGTSHLFCTLEIDKIDVCDDVVFQADRSDSLKCLLQLRDAVQSKCIDGRKRGQRSRGTVV